ncbi:GNAT family N-acetyltransferase [Solibacillus silvestris]|uniref:GNAT family N-acetyltransferase n=1 Tax=Solibacillus silvestris TaxID=76853 RepID=UPI003F7DB5B1
MFPALETERLILREITDKDVHQIYSIFSNDDVTEHYGLASFNQLQQAENLVENFSANFQNQRGVRWGIERKDEKGLIGTIGFNSWSPMHKRAEIGYDLHPDSWGAGYASEAVAEIVNYGFQQMLLNRIGAIVFIENNASIQLLLRQGFEKEGVLKKYMHQNGKAYDVTVFAKFQSD